jgi:hypothetical protein
MQSKFQKDTLPTALTDNAIVRGLLKVVRIHKNNKTASFKK